MKKFYLLLLVLCGLLTACSSEGPITDEPTPVPQETKVSFKAFIAQATRATDTAFEDGDAISVFAVEPSSNIKLESYGNYADNVKYVYNGNTFKASSNAISFDESYEDGLAYYAMYPYSASASSKYTFNVETNQSYASNYTASDLCTSYNEPTADANVLLEFNHRLSNVEIKFYGSNLASKNLSVTLKDVYTKCNVDINANTFTATGSKQDVIMGEESANTFHAIIVPQTVNADDTFMVVSMNGKEIALSLSNTTEFKSGKKIVYEYEIKDDTIVLINGYINPWDTEEDVVPNYFTQDLYTATDEEHGIYPYNALFLEWVGQNVASFKFGLIKTEICNQYPDETIIEALTPAEQALVDAVNNGGKVAYFSGLTPSTSYTLCAYVTFADGETMYTTAECSTEASDESGSFYQELYTSDIYEEYGYTEYDTLFLDWKGTNVSYIWYGMFLTENIEGVSDEDIIDYISNTVDSEDIAEICSPEGVTYYFSGLASDTSYTLCTYVIFADGTTGYYKSTCATKEIPEEERLEYVIPAEIREKLDDYIPINEGIDPPIIEGTYFLDPQVTVYCEDYGSGGYEPGRIVVSEYLTFYNQNTTKNTIDFYEESANGSSWQEASGAFVMGEGNEFSAFFNTHGESRGIYTKTALLISGTKTSSGIYNLYYAFVMVEKGDDPNNELMAEGVFRVFKDQDGISSYTTRSLVYTENNLTGMFDRI